MQKLLRSFERIPPSQQKLPAIAEDSEMARTLRQLQDELSEVDGGEIGRAHV